MVWLSALLLIGGAALSAGLARRLWRTEGAAVLAADELSRSGVLLLETQRLHERQVKLADAQRLAEATVETGTDVVRAVHMGIAAIPFGVLEAVPVTRDVTRVVRRTHDLVSEAVYGSIKGVNRRLGTLARDVLKPSRPPPEPDEK